MQKVIITQEIIDYIEKHHNRFELPTPKLGEEWIVERVVKYPTLNYGKPVIELNNGKGSWMRLPKIIDNDKHYKIKIQYETDNNYSSR